MHTMYLALHFCSHRKRLYAHINREALPSFRLRLGMSCLLKWWWLFVIHCCILGALLTSAVDCLPSQVEADVVAEFFVATRYANATPVTQDNLCTSWAPMIVCSSEAAVSEMNFTSANLKGTLPSSMSQLTHIRYFNVTNNQLTGTLPPSLANWTQLNTFDVSNNNFTGSLPYQWSAWGGTIRKVKVTDNNLSGTLPPDFSTWSYVTEFVSAEWHVACCVFSNGAHVRFCM